MEHKLHQKVRSHGAIMLNSILFSSFLFVSDHCENLVEQLHAESLRLEKIEIPEMLELSTKGWTRVDGLKKSDPIRFGYSLEAVLLKYLAEHSLTTDSTTEIKFVGALQGVGIRNFTYHLYFAFTTSGHPTEYYSFVFESVGNGWRTAGHSTDGYRLSSNWYPPDYDGNPKPVPRWVRKEIRQRAMDFSIR